MSPQRLFLTPRLFFDTVTAHLRSENRVRDIHVSESRRVSTRTADATCDDRASVVASTVVFRFPFPGVHRSPSLLSRRSSPGVWRVSVSRLTPHDILKRSTNVSTPVLSRVCRSNDERSSEPDYVGRRASGPAGASRRSRPARRDVPKVRTHEHIPHRILRTHDRYLTCDDTPMVCGRC